MKMILKADQSRKGKLLFVVVLVLVLLWSAKSQAVDVSYLHRSSLWGLGELVDKQLSRQLVDLNKSEMQNALDRADWEAVPATVFNANQLEGTIRAVNRAPLLMVSAAPDKIRVGSIGLSCAPFVLPIEIAW